MTQLKTRLPQLLPASCCLSIEIKFQKENHKKGDKNQRLKKTNHKQNEKKEGEGKQSNTGWGDVYKDIPFDWKIWWSPLSFESNLVLLDHSTGIISLPPFSLVVSTILPFYYFFSYRNNSSLSGSVYPTLHIACKYFTRLSWNFDFAAG